MRALTRAALPGYPAWLPSGFAVLDRANRHVLVLDPTLAPVLRIPAPAGDDRLQATISPDASLAAFASLDRTLVTSADGTVLWQRESVIERQGLPQQPGVHIDGAGRLWLYVPDGDHIAVFEAQSGRELARTGLSSAIGAGTFVAHPDGEHVGLSVAQGQDGTNSYWLRLDEGGIVVRELPGEALVGVAPSGLHYLDLPHVDTQVAIRAFADDHVLAASEAGEIAGFEPRAVPGFVDGPQAERSWRGRAGYGLNDGAAAYLDEDHVLVGVVSDAFAEDDVELHLVLSSRSLRWLETVDYGQYGPARQNSIVRGHDGRWLTYDWRAGIATLWEFDPTMHGDQPTLLDTL